MRKNILKYAAIAVLAVGLSSCHIYQKYELPEGNDQLVDYANAVNAPADSTQLGYLPWEEVYTDPVLQGYIRTALEKNINLENARLNVEIAQSQLKGAKLSYLPSLAFTPNGGTASYGGSHMNWSYTLPLAASWEIDAFAKILNRKRSAQVNVEMAEDYRQAARSQIIAGVAQCYYTLVLLNEQLDLTKRTAEIWKEQVNSMKLMKEAAMTNEAAVVQSEANYYSLMASIPTLETNIHKTQNSLSLLLCSYPREWKVASSLDVAIPKFAQDGVPMYYLATRPDVRAAERNMAVAYYATNSARANFYPSIVISAQGGFTNLLGSMIKNPGEWFIQLAGQLTAPLFSRGQNIATLEAAKAQQQQSMNNFQYAVLSAAADVSDALTEIKNSDAESEQYLHQAEALEKAVEYTQTLFTTADVTYLELLQARTGLLSAQMSLLQSKYDKLAGIIYLYQSVGGGR